MAGSISRCAALAAAAPDAVAAARFTIDNPGSSKAAIAELQAAIARRQRIVALSVNQYMLPPVCRVIFITLAE
ncbi:hypothetical protein M8494_15120 [Serratia ureilytica]